MDKIFSSPTGSKKIKLYLSTADLGEGTEAKAICQWFPVTHQYRFWHPKMPQWLQIIWQLPTVKEECQFQADIFNFSLNAHNLLLIYSLDKYFPSTEVYQDHMEEDAVGDDAPRKFTFGGT